MIVTHGISNKIRHKCLLFIIVLFSAFLMLGLDNSLRVVRYAVEAAGINQPVKLALVTDLHSCAYGSEMQALIDAIDAEAPDVILLGGDIFDDVLPDDNTEAFLTGIADRYPCWYVTGNHEYMKSTKAFNASMALLKKLNIPRLSGEAVIVDVRSQRFTLCGVDDPKGFGKHREYEAQVRQTASEAQDGSFTVLLAHRPEYAALYAECGFELVLCGHTHGGQWRIPGILNGLYAPGQGWLPEYAGGLYRVGNTAMIVSRGLAKESTRLPRFYNSPELVIVELRQEA